MSNGKGGSEGDEVIGKEICALSAFLVFACEPSSGLFFNVTK